MSVTIRNFRGFRWLSGTKGDFFDGQEPIDSFGEDGATSELYYDLSGHFEAKLDESVVSHVGQFLQFKFDCEVKRQTIYLFWQKQPDFGRPVDNILDDAERLWSIVKDHYGKLLGRSAFKRE